MKTCPECSSEKLFCHSNISSSGGYGPTLLPELGGFLNAATMQVVLCADCGLVRFYADPPARAKALEKWKPVNEA